MLNLLKELKQAQLISEADFYFAKLISDKQQPFSYPEPVANLAILLAAVCSFQYQRGHSCVELKSLLNKSIFDLAYKPIEEDYFAQIQQKIGSLPVQQWQTSLQQHIAFSCDPFSKISPLLFQNGALYFYRVWQDEYNIARYLKNFPPCQPISVSESKIIAEKLDRLFKPQSHINWQKIAVAVALRQPFCIIAGGPGTGKTTTVSRLLVLLLELSQKPLRIKLAAPTGKAAARLTESLNAEINRLANSQDVSGEPLISEQLKAQIPKTAETIHRLLGIQRFSENAKFNKNNQLQLDLLILDEVSMVDLALMAKLVSALSSKTRLILLGDKDQLSAVEAGAVLAKLTALQSHYSNEQISYLRQTTGYELGNGETTETNILTDSLCFLRESHRAKFAPWIMALAHTINQGNSKQSLQLLTTPMAKWPITWQQSLQFLQQKTNDVLTGLNFIEYATTQEDIEINQIIKFVSKQYASYLNLVAQLQGKEPDNQQLTQIFQQFNRVRLLTALRVGKFGTENLNQKIAEYLRQQGKITFFNPHQWYVGKPIMISQNDSTVSLYNGDIGLYLGEGQVYFEQGKGDYRKVMISRIPHHELAFAMTVHKSQGSEFEHTILVLPQAFNPILSKELIYTAVTRAKVQISIFTQVKIWQQALERKIIRQSGLAILLKDKNPINI